MVHRDRGRTIAILGAGPIGIEAALYGLELGHDVQVYEAGRVGEHVRSWGELRFFSPWEINRSQRGLDELIAEGQEPEPADAYPTGSEYCDRYLEPLARGKRLAPRIHESCRVLHVGRDRIGKSDLLGGPREDHAFRLMISAAGGERVVLADTVLDCSGTYGNPNWMGNGNIPALGERDLRPRIANGLHQLSAASLRGYAGQRVLLVGSGHSAATALELLLELPETSIVWVTRGDRAAPLPRVSDDPLPERDRLSRLANRIAGGSEPRVEFRPATVVHGIEPRDDGFDIALTAEESQAAIHVDRVVALVGYSPDNSIYRELQVHECYASFGPIKLAATLFSGDSADCLNQDSPGPDALCNPEPNFFVLGAKSYGKHSNFLIRTGLQQLRDVLDRYASTTRVAVTEREY